MLTVAGVAPEEGSVMSVPGTLTWTCSAPLAAAPNCAFFDFNWVGLFTLSTTGVVDDTASISVTTQAGGNLKAFVLSVPEPGGMVVGPRYNTVRVMKTTPQPISLGVYTFVFEISNTSGVLSSVTLNLTVTT